MSASRTARRERNREDFLRATRQGLRDAGHHKQVATAGVNAGLTIEEHLEDELAKACRVYNRLTEQATNPGEYQNVDQWGAEGIELKRGKARGLVRGLAKALLIYRDSYNKDNKHMLAQIEKEFMSNE